MPTPMRLQEVHPALVHFPITLLPVSVGADALGRLTGSGWLLRTGKWGMVLTAGSAAVSAFFGLVAQEEVELEGEAHDLLVTHRTLNAGFVALSTAMAVRRLGRARPSLRYLAAGVAGIAAVGYSAYLGGKMVYEHGVGVERAGGVRAGHGPELTVSRVREVARHAVDDAGHGLRHAAQDLTRGEVVPALTRSVQKVEA